jgi:hypothetical protein
MNSPERPAQTLEESLTALAATIRDAGESLLDLQEALAKLRVATEPALADQVSDEVSLCMRNAMRG